MPFLLNIRERIKSRLRSLRSRCSVTKEVPCWHEDWSLQIPLPPRARSISCEPDDTSQTTYDQSQSILFSKLPKEIRLLIYEEVIGRKLIHLGFIDHVLHRRFCYDPCRLGHDLETWHEQCWFSYRHLTKSPGERLLALLHTCHLVFVPEGSFSETSIDKN